MARLLVGGKYGNQVVFSGNRRFLPPAVRRVLSAYFGNFNTLRDITGYPGLLQELSDVRAHRYFEGTDWEGLQKLYNAQLQRFTVNFSGRVGQDGARFRLDSATGVPAPALKRILDEFCDKHGWLRENFDLWRVDKLLRRAKAQLTSDRGFTAALKQFGARAISFEDSLSFFRQLQAYHAEPFLDPELAALLTPHLDKVHTLLDPLELPQLAGLLRQAGAEVRIHPGVQPVLEHHSILRRFQTGEGAPELGVANVLAGKLNVELYPFQREGAGFLAFNRRALLADDMGLGKTAQSIAASIYLKERNKLKRVLVVCPASLKYQWQAEIQRFSGERCEVIGGDKAEREAIYRAAALTAAGKADGIFTAPEDAPFFYVINYELLYRDFELVQKIGAELLILDEAQRVKNFRTKTAKAVFDLPCPYVFVLTGTPLENQLMELFTILKFIDDRALGKNPLSFRERYVISDRFGGIAGYRHVEEVSRKIAALTLRRTKQQTLSQLPPLVESLRWLEFTDVQRRIYNELQGEAREVLADSVWDQLKANNALTLLQRLREVCDTPELIDPQFTDSPKVEELKALLEDEVNALDRQVLVFTQWTRMGVILLRELTAANYSAVFLHGGLDARARQQVVDTFQAGQASVLISTDAGGTGLNLQAASLVVNFDLPFNPAKVNQRIARAHRLGQQGTVFAVNLLCRGTVEHNILGILKEKQSLFDDVFGEISDPDQAKPGQQLSLRELLSRVLAESRT